MSVRDSTRLCGGLRTGSTPVPNAEISMEGYDDFYVG